MTGINIGKVKLALTLYEVEEQFIKHNLKDYYDQETDLSEVGGKTWIMSNGYEYCHLVFLNIEDMNGQKIRKKSWDSCISILAHEAVHIAQHWLDFIGEDAPGKEIEAYAIESAFDELVSQFRKRVKKWKK